MDDAWNAVEQALPDNWLFSVTRRKDGTGSAIARSAMSQRTLEGRRSVRTGLFGGIVRSEGNSPADALWGLARRLNG